MPDPWVGDFRGNTFRTAADHGGKTTVRAEAAGKTSETSLTVIYRKTILTEGFPNEAVQDGDGT